MLHTPGRTHLRETWAQLLLQGGQQVFAPGGRLRTTAGWPEAPRRSSPLGAGDTMSPPPRRRQPSCVARWQPSTTGPLTAGRGRGGRPLAQSSVPGATPICLALLWSWLTRPRCMRRFPLAGSVPACDPSSPGPRTVYTGVAVSKRTAGPSFLVKQRWRHPPGTALFTWDELSQGLDLALAQNAVSVGDSVWVQALRLRVSPSGGFTAPLAAA